MMQHIVCHGAHEEDNNKNVYPVDRSRCGKSDKISEQVCRERHEHNEHEVRHVDQVEFAVNFFDEQVEDKVMIKQKHCKHNTAYEVCGNHRPQEQKVLP